MRKYLQLANYTNDAGLGHQQHNVLCLLNYAYKRNQILVLPRFRLAAHHNRGRELCSDLSEYFDFNRLTIDSEKYPVQFSTCGIDEDQIEQLWVDPEELQAAKFVLAWMPQFEGMFPNTVKLPYQAALTGMAQDVATRLGPFTCIHVRRGDRITSRQIDIDTQCENILDKIEKCGLESVYIMTNEEPGFFESLNNTPYKISFSKDFPELAAIDDNFFLYSVEWQIMKLASRRVGTFPPDEPSEGQYHYFLSA